METVERELRKVCCQDQPVAGDLSESCRLTERKDRMRNSKKHKMHFYLLSDVVIQRERSSVEVNHRQVGSADHLRVRDSAKILFSRLPVDKPRQGKNPNFSCWLDFV